MRRFINHILAVMIMFSIFIAIDVLIIDYYVEYVGKKHIVDFDEASEADCILILGAFVDGDTASFVLSQRLEMGYKLYKSGKAKKILVSGDHGDPTYNEVRVMRNYLVKKGVPPEDIFMDHAGFNTYASVYRAKEVFLVKKVIIVTQYAHLVRALYISSQLSLPCEGVSANQTINRYQRFVQRPREYLARVKAFIDCQFLRSKPKYLGTPIPITGSGLLTDDTL